MNSKIVPADICINEAIVSKVISEQFGIRANTIILLGEGWDNAVYLVDNQWVFRFPRREIAVELIEREMRILPKLIGHLNLNIPHPIYFGKPSCDFSRPFYGHQIVQGQSGCQVVLSLKDYVGAAKTLAKFLRDLHSLDTSALSLDGPDLEPVFNRTDFPLLLSNFNDRLRQVEENYDLSAYRDKINNICSKAHDYQPQRDRCVLIHNDLYHRHLLFNAQNQLNGVIDWGDCGIGDAVVDLGVVFQFFPPAAHQSFFKVYGQIEERALSYARFLGLYYSIALLWFGHDRKDSSLIATSMQTLKQI